MPERTPARYAHPSAPVRAPAGWTRRSRNKAPGGRFRFAELTPPSCEPPCDAAARWRPACASPRNRSRRFRRWPPCAVSPVRTNVGNVRPERRRISFAVWTPVRPGAEPVVGDDRAEAPAVALGEFERALRRRRGDRIVAPFREHRPERLSKDFVVLHDQDPAARVLLRPRGWRRDRQAPGPPPAASSRNGIPSRCSSSLRPSLRGASRSAPRSQGRDRAPCPGRGPDC